MEAAPPAGGGRPQGMICQGSGSDFEVNHLERESPRQGGRRDGTARKPRITPEVIDHKRSGPAFACAPQLGQTLGDLGLLSAYRVGVRGDRRFRPEDVAAFPRSQPKRVGKPGVRVRSTGSVSLRCGYGSVPTEPHPLFPSDLSTPPVPTGRGQVRGMASPSYLPSREL